MRTRSRLLAFGTLLCGLAIGLPEAQAQSTQGFTINRYEPTAAGEWSFAVDHPWFSDTRRFAGGLTLNYANRPLVYGVRDGDGIVEKQTIVIENQFILHVDLAASFANRVTVGLSLPITLVETGTPVENVRPQAVTVGDPRLSAIVRLYGHPDASAFSISLGASLWAPLRAFSLAGDTGFRILPRVILGGLKHRVRWSVTGGFYYRPEAQIGFSARSPGNSAGSELQLGASIYYADLKRRWALGPEATFGTVLVGGQPFRRDYSALETLLGFHYNIKRQVLIGAAGGIGLLRQPGTPDFRILLRVAYAPLFDKKKKPLPPPDRDHDGIPDREDACPDAAGERSQDPQKNGCPLPADRDHDGVVDEEDRCPDEPQGAHPDPRRPGCPVADSDRDGVLDDQDRCPGEPQGAHPNPEQPGCPDGDKDRDGVLDHQDPCPGEPAGLQPDPARPGCPLPDRDKDQVPDQGDACPDQPGAPSPDPKRNGCPGLVQIRNGTLQILQPVHFATGKDVILAKSFPVLQAVADALKAQPNIKRMSVEGHTDNRGVPEKNQDLSERRAKSVVRWLVEHGIAAERLEAHGYGQTRPITTNDTEAGRAENRRVEFHIVDPAQ